MENTENKQEDILYNEEEIAELKRTIEVLQSQKDDLIETKLPSNVDKFAIDYVKLLDEGDLSYLTTKEVFDNYIEYRRKFTTNGEDMLSIRMLNAVIRKYFPNARINHSNKQKKNRYFWVFDE